MSNLDLTLKEYLSILESDYSATKENEFVICKKEEYKSSITTKACFATKKDATVLSIDIIVNIKKEKRFLYQADRRESDTFKNARSSLETPINMIRSAEDILNCIIVFHSIAGVLHGLSRSKRRVYVTSYDPLHISSHRMEIRLDTNKVSFDYAEVPMSSFCGLINEFTPYDFVNNRIDKGEMLEKFKSIIKREEKTK